MTFVLEAVALSYLPNKSLHHLFLLSSVNLNKIEPVLFLKVQVPSVVFPDNSESEFL